MPFAFFTLYPYGCNTSKQEEGKYKIKRLDGFQTMIENADGRLVSQYPPIKVDQKLDYYFLYQNGGYSIGFSTCNNAKNRMDSETLKKNLIDFFRGSLNSSLNSDWRKDLGPFVLVKEPIIEEYAYTGAPKKLPIKSDGLNSSTAPEIIKQYIQKGEKIVESNKNTSLNASIFLDGCKIVNRRMSSEKIGKAAEYRVTFVRSSGSEPFQNVLLDYIKSKLPADIDLKACLDDRVLLKQPAQYHELLRQASMILRAKITEVCGAFHDDHKNLILWGTAISNAGDWGTGVPSAYDIDETQKFHWITTIEGGESQLKLSD